MNNWPEEFLQRMKIKFGDEYPDFLNSLSTPAPISIRKNPRKNIEAFENENKIPWSEKGYYLPSRPQFIFDPLFHAGAYYVQEASSQFLEKLFSEAISDNPSPVVLDLCAAPGGKTSHLLSLLDGKGILVSNEIIATRNSILRENIAKWGFPNVVVTQNNAQQFSKLRYFFDVIVVDAPCSGEGLFRRDPDASKEWSEENVEMCSTRQQEILQNILNSLKPGGYLIYSTCTFEDSENKNQIKQLINSGNYSFENNACNTDGIIKSEEGFEFFPHKIKGEGLFISMLKKADDDLPVNSKSKKSIPIIKFDLSEYISNSENYISIRIDDRIFAINKNHLKHLEILNQFVTIRQSGIFAGTIKGNDFIPSAQLALSLELNADIPRYEIDLETALNYLRGQNIFIPDAKTGWAIVSYRKLPLGWIKILSGRINNYYPKEWRIRKQ